MNDLISDPKVLGAISVIVFGIVYTFFSGGSSSQEAIFNGNNNVQSSDSSRTINVEQNAHQSQGHAH